MYRGLLFSLYALHNGFLSNDQLLASIQAWVADRSKTLDDILVEHSALTDEERRILWSLVNLVLEKHDIDETQAIARLTWAVPIRNALLPLVIDDPEMSGLVAIIGEPSLATWKETEGNAVVVDPWSTWIPNSEDDSDTAPISRAKGSQPFEQAPSKNSAEAVDPNQLAAIDQDPFETFLDSMLDEEYRKKKTNEHPG